MSSTTNKSVESMTMEEPRKELESYGTPMEGLSEKEDLVKAFKRARDATAKVLMAEMQLPQDPRFCCLHGARHHSKLFDVFFNVIKDLKRWDLLRDGEQEKEEIQERIEKTQSLFLDEEGNSLILKEVYSYCAHLILTDDMEEARKVCLEALLYEVVGLVRGEPHMSKLPQAMSTIQTDQQLIVHVSKRIPCKCLRKKRKELGLREATAKCNRCGVEKHDKLMLICPNCNIFYYCSKKCYNKGWKKHQKCCRRMCYFNSFAKRLDARTELHNLGHEIDALREQLDLGGMMEQTRSKQNSIIEELIRLDEIVYSDEQLRLNDRIRKMSCRRKT